MSETESRDSCDPNSISGSVIIRPNFVIPASEKSDLLKVFVEERIWETEKNFRRTYRLRKSDGTERDVIVGYIFEPTLAIPDHLLLSIREKHEFVGMMPHTPESPILALVSLMPPESATGGAYHETSPMNSLEIHDFDSLDFIVMEGRKLGEIMNAWDRISEAVEPGTAQDLSARYEEPFEKALFLERNRGLYTTYFCEEYFKLKLSDQSRLPKDCQHLAVRNNYLIYATPRLVASTGFNANLYKRGGKNPIGFWPPQLMRCGSSIYWSQNSGRELMRWKDSEDDDFHKAVLVCDFREREIRVRRIAAADSTDNDRLAILVTSRGDWRILFFPDVNKGKFIDLGCPLRSIDSVVVMNGVVYALGSSTDSLFPDVMVFYKDGCWSEGIKRIQLILPTALFPLNGRIFLFSNGIEVIEVFDPQSGWSLNRIPPNMNDICGFTLFNSASDKRPVELPRPNEM